MPRVKKVGNQQAQTYRKVGLEKIAGMAESTKYAHGGDIINRKGKRKGLKQTRMQRGNQTHLRRQFSRKARRGGKRKGTPTVMLHA